MILFLQGVQDFETQHPFAFFADDVENLRTVHITLIDASAAAIPSGPAAAAAGSCPTGPALRPSGAALQGPGPRSLQPEW